MGRAQSSYQTNHIWQAPLSPIVFLPSKFWQMIQDLNGKRLYKQSFPTRLGLKERSLYPLDYWDLTSQDSLYRRKRRKWPENFEGLLCLDGIAFAFTPACSLIPPTFAYTYASILSTGWSTSLLASRAVYVTSRYATRPGARYSYRGYEQWAIALLELIRIEVVYRTKSAYGITLLLALHSEDLKIAPRWNRAKCRS